MLRIGGNAGEFQQTPAAFSQKLVAALAVGLLAWPAVAQESTPNTFVDWPVPNLTQWNMTNARTVVKNEADAFAMPTDVSYIYPDQAARDADIEGTGAGSVAFISWALDDGSGRPPGLQVVTDDFAFPTNNCLMTSGERDDPELGIVPKTCSDPEASSRRWFLEVTEADVPIDLVFDTGVKTLRYKGVRDPAEDGGADLEAFRREFGIGRIYQVLGKFLNMTGDRIVALRVEVGTGIGDQFTPLQFADDGIGFELRPFVDREFFEGETGAPDISAWDPMRFAAMAPKLFDDGAHERFEPGFFDDASAGLIPPQNTGIADQHQFIDSGVDLQDGIVGAITPNHFDIPANQGMLADLPLVGNVFGYLLPAIKAPFVIARHDDGDPETESDALVAWWDGFNYRYGLAGDPDLGIGSYGTVPETRLHEWAALPLGLDPVLTPDPARFEFLLSDDHANVAMDIFLHVSERMLDATTGLGQPRLDNITLRFVAGSAEGLGLGGIAGTADPDWIEPENEAPPLIDFMPVTGRPVAINDLAVTLENESVNIKILANDLLDGKLVDPALADLSIVSAPDNGEAFLVDDADNTIDYTPTAGFSGEDAFAYTVTVMGEASNPAIVKITVDRPPIADAPVAANDSDVTFEFNPVTIDVLANDTLSGDLIPNGARLDVIDQPVSGVASASVVGDRLVYDPKATPPGTIDVFTYRVTVDEAPSNLALVIVRVDETVDAIFANGFEGTSAVFEPDTSQVDADIDVAVRAARDDERIALRFSWQTNKNYAGLLHDIRTLDPDGEWTQPAAEISIDDPKRVNEDRISIVFGVEDGGALAIESEYFGCFQSCHSDMNGMPDATVDARHYVLPLDAGQLQTFQSDMWHWRGSRSGPVGFAEDTWVRAHDFDTGAQGRQRDEIGPDGNLRETQRFNTVHTVTIDGQAQVVNLPEFVYDPDINSGFYFLNDGRRLITRETIGNLFSSQTIGKMEAGQLQHQLIVNGPRANAIAVADLDQATRDEIAVQALSGGIINRPLLSDDTSGTSDQHDIEAGRRFDNGTWTVTLFRDLATGSPLDIDLSAIASRDYPMAFAVHDSNDSGRSHQVSVPLTLGAGGSIEPVEVADVQAVNWLAIAPFNTKTFKPGDMSFQWLDESHPVRVDTTCSSCHSLFSEDHGPQGPRPPGSCLNCHSDGNRAAKVWEYAPLGLQN